MSKEIDSLRAELADAQAEMSVQTEIIKGAPWYKDIEILQREKREFAERVFQLEKELDEALSVARCAEMAFPQLHGDMVQENAQLTERVSQLEQQLRSPVLLKAFQERARMREALEGLTQTCINCGGIGTAKLDNNGEIL